MTADERSLSEQNVKLLQQNSSLAAHNRALWMELQAAADTLQLAAKQLEKDTGRKDLAARLLNEATQARRVLAQGEG